MSSARTSSAPRKSCVAWLLLRGHLPPPGLLAHGSEPTVRIAENLGFDDPSNFAKYFHHRTGTTPTEFRSRVRAPFAGSM
ncbi:helix-turn-helix domain-containing protein [Nocardia sp. NPDC049737]|uniref:helix-turn-helix domain-containing protein n=1 Tax=Nocardia sp. NPDC049737 TaxID=3154358 RepID=UPI00341F52D7